MIAFLKRVGSFPYRLVSRLLSRFRRWRWWKTKPKREDELTTYRMPIQVCPRGCEYHEAARRDLIARTTVWGRVETRVVATFETESCPECGAALIDECPRCEEEIYAPIADRCRFCGLPQPWAAARRVAAERASVRKWRPEKGGVSDSAMRLYNAGHGRELWMIDGDITRLEVDAVVSSVDVDGQMWSEVASAIRNAAGEEVEQRAQDGKPYKLGKAWITNAGNLAPKRKGIIHVASMNRRGESDLLIVRTCLEEAMRVAVKEGYESIGIGAFGSGPSAIPRDQWLQTFVATVVRFLTGDFYPESREEALAVILVLFEQEELAATHLDLMMAVNNEFEALGRPSWCEPEPFPVV
jgi:O-acetyl-ADP-ribose deacetylase (regulator of RNase III)